MTRDLLEQFFSRYAAAFSAGDGDGVAALWAVPSAISDSRDGVARLTVWHEASALLANMRALCQAYAAAGPHQWEFQLQHVEALGAQHAYVRVGWRMLRPDCSVIQTFSTAYQLGLQADGWKLLFCTAFQEDLGQLRRQAKEAQ